MEAALNCPSCGHANRAGARFCGSCGSSLVADVICGSCGHENPPANRFCDNCGQALSAGGRPTAADAATPQPDQAHRRPSPPEHLAQKILTGRGALEGERKQVTVLFADVQGSMDLAERTDPEHWRAIMERFFSILSEGVHRFEGTVDKFTGDGIMALFGAPIAHEDHALRACYAALGLHEALADYAGELRRTDGLNFSMRIGVNSGEVVVGAIGDDLSLEYTAIGHTVGLAQRMEQLAEPGKTYLTEHTARLVEGYLKLRDLGEFEVKGATAPLRAYELSGIGAARSRLDLSRARGFSRFVGRDAELDSLKAALGRTLEGEGQLVGVRGEAGVGKSRLCHELVEHARARGIPVYHAAGTSHGRTIPFLAALEMLRGYFGVSEHDDDQVARERIAGRLLLLDPAFGEDLPLVFDFLGVPDPERPAPSLNPEGRQRQLLDTVRRLVHAHGRREAAINLLEDLHWIDGGSAVFLEALVEAIPGSRSLTVLNVRPEYEAEWMSKPYYQELSLVPLGPNAANELLCDLIGADRSLNGLSEEVRQRTGGNPFFIEEVVRGLVEDGSLEGEAGSYRLVRPIGSLSVPPTVEAVLAARIDRLDERDKWLLQAAAVLGREFGESILERIAEMSPPELASALRALVGGEFLFQQALYPEPEYAFAHPLTQEVAYRSQLSDRRGRVHAAVARAIADLYPESLDERAALLAHHWEGAGERLEAARWHARAATWAGTSDPAVAVRHWRRVRELVDALPETPETAGLGIGARTSILLFGWRLGILPEEAESLYTEGKQLAERAGDRASLALLTATYAGTMGLSGGMQKALTLMTEADEALEELGIPALRVAVLQYRISALFVCGRAPEGVPLADLALELTGADPTLGAGVAVASPHAFFHVMKSIMVSTLGHLREGHQLAERAIEVAREQGDLETEGWGQMAHALAAYYAGETEEVLPAATRSIEIAERIGDAFSRCWAQTYLGLAHVMRGEWDAAAEVLERSVALSDETRTGLEGEPWRLAFLTEAHLGRGEPEEAIEVAQRAVASVRDLQLDNGDGVAQLALGRALLASERKERMSLAESALSNAVEAARATQMPPIEARAHAARAELERMRGDREAEERELRAARAIAEQIGATGLTAAIDERLRAAAAAAHART